VNTTGNVVGFPGPEEERARCLKIEVERLARLPLIEWMFYLDDTAKKHGLTSAKLKTMVEGVIKAAEKKVREAKAEDQKREQRAERKQATERREERRASERQQREERREQERADREARARQRELDRELAALAKLPSAEHESRLAALAERLGEDLGFLQDQFGQFVRAEDASSVAGDVEPWPEPVDAKALLPEVMAQVRRYVVLHDEGAAVAVVLWIFFAWVHAEIAVHSPLLALTGADADTGKTTLCGVLQQLTPRAYAAAELTGPNLYRFVDHLHPTLIIDDADQLFARKPDLVHIVNVGWTRGTLVPRQDHGVTRWFSPFCPKVVAGVNLVLPRTTATRSIIVKLLPKLPDEKVEDFNHVDDESFFTLRRKLKRWAADNMTALKTARPAMSGLNNRLCMNWKVLFAIADLCGGDWPKRARMAAIKLSRGRREPSEGKRLLQAFRDLFTKHSAVLTSAEVVKLLTADDDSEWVDFHGHGPITKRQVALLLDPYDIHPNYIHPSGHKSERGYRAEWFATAFKHFLGKSLPLNCATARKKARYAGKLAHGCTVEG
jgi:putative DNA primase/helicase